MIICIRILSRMRSREAMWVARDDANAMGFCECVCNYTLPILVHRRCSFTRRARRPSAVMTALGNAIESNWSACVLNDDEESRVSLFLRRWYYNRNQREEPIEESSGHYVVRDGSLIIQSVEENDAGSYMCTASNSEGSETLEIRLTVSAPLSVHVQPAIQTVDLGKSAYLVINHYRHRSIYPKINGRLVIANA